MVKMMRFKTFRLLLLCVFVGIMVSSAWADSEINIEVKTVLASQQSTFFDPRLADLIEELRSVFRYTSYRLLSEDRLVLGIRETGNVVLPGKRVLRITPLGIRGNRAELRLVILRKRNKILQTVVRLRNHGSITVGGPRYQKKGHLLFNISNSF